ncbi:MAG: protein-ADP-ribose hydrolase [Firmicutes bacterium]|nr:protein-ADP-ribose hydrolase [Bacillota bacterium]
MKKEKILNHLISFLSLEHGEKINLPNTFQEKFRLYRALVNIRGPKEIDEDFLHMQDDFLLHQIKTKSITDIKDLVPLQDGIYLWQGDITLLKVDAIVNAANCQMLGCFVPCHGCIDNAIHTFAGTRLRNECAKIMTEQGFSEPTGMAKITKAYNLPSKYILHTVGPIVNGAISRQNQTDLANCYCSCLTLAEQQKLSSVAFCCISTGEFRYPKKEAAQLAIETVQRYIKNKGSSLKIIFNVFTQEDYEIYKQYLSANQQT